MASIITFINMKGGVGKTTLCVGIGVYLSEIMNKKILIVDLDPQFNSTQSLLNKYNKVDLYFNELLTNEKTIRKIYKIPNSITDRVQPLNKEDVIVNLTTNLDIILGDINIIFDDSNRDIRVKKLKKFIDDNNLRNEYDYILIDSPPTISLYTDTALVASDFYLTPVKIDQYSLLGASSLLTVINNLIENYELKIKSLGFIYTNVEDSMTDKTKKIKERFEKHSDFSDFYFFKNKLSFVRDLMVGMSGNILSSYQKSKNDASLICQELEDRVNSLQKEDNDEQ